MLPFYFGWNRAAFAAIIYTMDVTVYPGSLSGTVKAPCSKSHMIRLLIASALCPGGEKTVIEGASEGRDVLAAEGCLRALGAGIEKDGEGLTVTGMGKRAESAVLDCEDSATALRMLLPVCAALAEPEEITVKGSEALASRPHAPLIEALRENGALIGGEGLPLTVRGGLAPGEFSLPGDISSQFFSGLLFALPLLEGESLLRHTGPLVSRPYVDMSLAVLGDMGVDIESLEDGWKIKGPRQFRSPGRISCEGDWSAAAYWLAANRSGSSVKVEGLSPSSLHADRAAVTLLDRIGSVIDVSACPDLMPVLAAAAAASPGETTRIKGAARLRFKESDRLFAMKEVINSLGGSAAEEADGLLIEGRKLGAGTVSGMNDHRVVMSAAVLALACEGPVTITGAEAVAKSYPAFWRDFEALGGITDVR